MVMIFLALVAIMPRVATAGLARDKKPNIVVIKGDDVGMWNIGAFIIPDLMPGSPANEPTIANS
jgi:arylsulfatase A-like enzyme